MDKAPLVELFPWLVPNTESAFLTALLPQVGHCSCRSRLVERTSFSNLVPQPSQIYSKIGIHLPPHSVRQCLLDQPGKVVCVHIANHHDPVVD